MSGLEAVVRVERPGFSLDLALTAGPGEVVALLGPNGAGKTTALRALAGLEPMSGRVQVDDAVLTDSATSTLRPPAERRIGIVFQDYRLFPHLSVLDNVAFGPRSAGLSRVWARDNALPWY